ncbi:MAG: SDR family oxidoreductase [Acidobacteriota bacterium]|nr:MAG: SDR family oxidoreductase [Acidobacteriota bacterium]
MPLEGPLRGKVAVVTGGRRGIGLATVKALAQRGARVVATSREVRGFPPAIDRDVVFAQLDVQDDEAIRRLFDWVGEEVGRLDVLVNNAGLGRFGPVGQTRSDTWHELLETNLIGPALCSRAALPLMRQSGGGRIINLGSIAGRMPLAENGAYGASKAGLRLLSQVLAIEERGHGIRTTHVTLGAVATDIWDDREGFDRRQMLDPSRVGEIVAGIASEPLSVALEEVQLMPPGGIL